MSIKSPALVLLIVLYVLEISAQPNGKFKEWGQVTLDDLKITECSFEKNADALLLLDLADLYYDKEDNFFSGGRFSITTTYYQRFKVFTERGSEQANFKFKFRSADHENIGDIKGASYNLGDDGQIQRTALAKADVHFTKLNEYETEVAFTIPGVKKGSVFELGYYRNQYVNYTLPSWYFHSDVPSLNSTIRIGFLDAIEYYVEKHITHNEFQEKAEIFTSNIEVPTAGGYGREILDGKTVTYTARNLPSVNPEPFMNSRVNYADHLSFQLKAFHHPLNPSSSIISSWYKLNSYLLNNPMFGGNITEGGIPKKVIKELINNTIQQDNNNEEKAKTIFEFVRKNMNWNGLMAMIPKEDNLHAWKIKSGNSADINLLLINALRQQGITVYPMLVGSRYYGYLNTEYPILEQFKSVVAMVDLGNKKKVILDATDKFLPFGIPKYDILNNYGYIIRSETDADWYRMLNESSNTESVFIDARLSNNNTIQGDITATYYNYSQANFRRMKAFGKQDLINDELKKKVPNVTIESSKDTVDESRNVFIQTVKFTTQPVTDNNENIYLSIPSIYGETTNPFVSTERISAVDFGYKQKISKVLQFEIPDNYEIDSLFKPKGLITSDTSITFLFDAEILGNVLLIRQSLDYKLSLYPAKDYPEFYEFHQQYYKLIGQPVVLKKKK